MAKGNPRIEVRADDARRARYEAAAAAAGVSLSEWIRDAADAYLDATAAAAPTARRPRAGRPAGASPPARPKAPTAGDLGGVKPDPKGGRR